MRYDPEGLHEFIVESREPSTQHRLSRNIFDAWLRRPVGSPADVALKTRLSSSLGIFALAVAGARAVGIEGGVCPPAARASAQVIGATCEARPEAPLHGRRCLRWWVGLSTASVPCRRRLRATSATRSPSAAPGRRGASAGGGEEHKQRRRSPRARARESGGRAVTADARAASTTSGRRTH